MKALKWILTIGAVFLIFGLIGALFYPVNNISVEKVEITDVRDVSLKGFIIDGNLHIENPSIFKIPVENINYELVLENTGDVLFSGAIPPFVLERSSTTVVPFTMDVRWRSTVNAAILMATQKNVNAAMIGTAQLKILGFNYDYPFESEMDLKAMLKNALR